MSDGRGALEIPREPADLPISIAHVHWALPPVAGGIETHLAEFTRVLVTRGHPVAVFTGRGGAELDPRVTVIPCELLDVDRYDGRPPGDEDRLVDELAAMFREKLDSLKIKIVHGHNLHHFSPVPAMALGQLREELDLCLHHTYHSFWDPDPNGKDRADIARICRLWPGQHAVSRYIRDRCDRKLDIRTKLTYLGVPWDRYEVVRPPAMHRADRVVLLPARLMPEKGAENAVAMLKQLREEGIAVRLILTTPDQTVDWDGSAPGFRAKVETLVESHGLSGVVEFRSVRFDEMPQLYEQSDIVIYPSTYAEPLGIAPLEAAAAGRPVVVTNLGGLPETVIDGKTGFVVPPNDVDALTSSVRTLLTDPDRALQFGLNGRDRVRENFTLDAYTHEMISQYRSTSSQPL
jgi:glycosyltransferase involved in cell wall biosynthesis